MSHQVRIIGITSQEGVVRAAFDDFAFFEDQNLISVLDRAQPMGDHNDGL